MAIFNKVLDKFITQHLSQLNSMPSAFFGVNLTARKAEKSTPETNAYMRKFLDKTPWKPRLTGVLQARFFTHVINGLIE